VNLVDLVELVMCCVKHDPSRNVDPNSDTNPLNSDTNPLNSDT
jgi:hypothetical protein